MGDPTPTVAVSVTITQLVIAALPLVLPVTLTSLATFIVAIRNRDAAASAADHATEAKQVASVTASKVDDIRVSVNGRLSELMAAVTAKAASDVVAAHAAGRHLGILEGREQATREAMTPQLIAQPAPPHAMDP